MTVLLIGLSHKTAPVEIRERLNFSRNTLRSLLTHFDTTHRQAHLADVAEGVVLSTCNRTEVYASVRDPDVAGRAIVDLLSRVCETPAAIFAEHLYLMKDEAAVRHLFRVACGLDSMVLGEPQILGQITDAYEAALSQKSAGTILSGLFRAAIHVGKRARTETRIGLNHASISSVAASLSQDLLGDLSQRSVLLVGAGEMGAIAVRALMKRGVTDVTVVNRTFENAEALAKTWDGKAVAFQQLPRVLGHSDIVITCTGAPHMILNKKLVQPAMQSRLDRPLFMIDIAVPRDIDPDVIELENVHLHDIDDLQHQADNCVREREAEIPQVECIVEEEVAQSLDWLLSLDAVSTITDLRRQLEQVRQLELERLFNKLDLDEREQKLVATMSHRLVNKILHKPTLCLKHEAAHGNGAAYTSIVRDLFKLEPSQNEAKPAAKSKPVKAKHQAENVRHLHNA